MIRFQLILAVVIAGLVSVHLPMASAQTVAFFDDFEMDENSDGSLDGDTSTSGHTWGDSIVGIVEDPNAPGGNSADQSVGAAWAWNSTNGSGTLGSTWTGNAAQFTKQTTGTWYWSMDVTIGNSNMQTVLRDTPDASGAVNTNNQTSSWFVKPNEISQEGLGGGALNTVVATFPAAFNAGDNVHVEFVYDLDNQMVTGSWFDNNNPATSGAITPLDYSANTKLEPNAFDHFTNSGGGGGAGLDNLRFADFPDDTPAPPPPTVFTWNLDGSGDWLGSNWTPNGTPDTNRETAIFGDKITSPQTVFTNSAVTVNRVEFDNANTYVIAGFGSVNVETNTVPTDPSIAVAQGSHQFQAVVNLNGTTTATIASGAALTFNNALNLNGNTLTKTGAGNMVVNNQLNTGGGSVVGLQGTISGSGTIGGDVDNQGSTVAPGNSPGILSITGNYSQSSNATLAIEIAGTSPGENGHDQLAVGGTATLDGTLDIQTDAAFTPAVGGAPGVIGDQFVILTASSVNGTFSTINGRHFGSGIFYLPAYNASNVTLGAFQAAPGDADGDRDVDITDFNVLASNFDPGGANSATNDWTTADFDLNGTVDITDFNGLASNFAPGGYGSSGPGQVPEPGALWLLGIGLLAVACWRRYGS